MTLRFDEKGKYYTDYITKESTPVVIQTITHHIRGYVYIQEDGRLSDELNSPERFLPVTQAVIFDFSGNKLFEAPFLAVNREHIVWIYPEEMPTPEDAYAVDELLVGDDLLLPTDEIYQVDHTALIPEAPTEIFDFEAEEAEQGTDSATTDDVEERN
jgi:hypothetical protein